MLPVETPFKTYTDLNGKPLDQGFVYFGQPNQNPITAPVTVYWDAAGTIPATQPLRTVNGYIMRAGTPANIFADQEFSELVLDKKKQQVFYARTSKDFSVIDAARSLLQQGVLLESFLPPGFDLVAGDCRPYIQAALNFRANGVIVKGGGKTYRITGSVYIRGNRKTLDFEGGQLVLDTNLDNQQAVVIDNPTATPTVGQALKNVQIFASAATAARNGCIAVALSGGVLHPRTESVYVQGFGQTSGNGGAMAIYGGPLGGNDTPYYGQHIDFKAQFCASGVTVGSNPSYPRITTHTFDNLTVGGCSGIGVLLSGAEFITLNQPNIEQNGGANLRFENCGTNFVFGGFNEGGHPNMETVNQDPLRANMILADMYPTEPAGTGTRVSTYYQNPAIGMQGASILLERVSGQQVIFGTDETLELKFAGIVTIQMDQQSFARVQLAGGAVDFIETGGANPLGFSSAQNTANKVNVYASGGKYYVQNKTGGGCGMRFFTQVGI